MDVGTKVLELRKAVTDALTPLVDADHWLLEVPHYSNIGDALIWQGELDFLRKLPFRCKGIASADTRSRPPVAPGDLVLFQGGGNFGDLYPFCHNYRKRIMSLCPSGRYVVLPQTVWYEDMRACEEDARFFGGYDCTICARDRRSYEFLCRHFRGNRIELVPDMAFCMDMRRWRMRVPADRSPLLLLRKDGELRLTGALEALANHCDVDILDWPTHDARTWVEGTRDLLRRHRALSGVVYERFMDVIYRPYLIRCGVEIVAQRPEVVTTRLHGGILAMLLGCRRIAFADNSYGKNRGFYETWLQNCENAEMVS